jgi:hypothetical protein
MICIYGQGISQFFETLAKRNVQTIVEVAILCSNRSHAEQLGEIRQEKIIVISNVFSRRVRNQISAMLVDLGEKDRWGDLTQN